MKAFFSRSIRTATILAAGIALVGCVDRLDGDVARGGYITFKVEGENAMSTRAMSERTSVTGFTCMALKSDNSVLINNVKTSRSNSDEILAGHYWPASGNCSFFGVLPNVNMTNSSGTVTFPVGTSASKLDGSEDYVFAKARNAANGQKVTMSFTHILSNLAGLALTGEKAGLRTEITSVTLSHPKYGTYQCAAGGDSWSGLGSNESTVLSRSFRSPSHLSGTFIEGAETGISTDNLSLIPGTWTVRIQYSVSAGSLSRNYDKSGPVTFAAGKKCTLKATLTNDINVLDISVETDDWNDSLSILALVEPVSNGYEYVDMGLPSGTVWAKCNVGAAAEEDLGNSYAWGDGALTTDGTDATYTSNNRGKTLTTNIPDNPIYDTAMAVMGGDWRMPSKEEIQELIDNCNVAFLNRNGTYGFEFTSKINGRKLFFPAETRDWGYSYSRFYWGKDISASPGSGSCLYFDNRSNMGVFTYATSYALGSVRGVMHTRKNLAWVEDFKGLNLNGKPYVDLGLPSGKLWGATACGSSYFASGYYGIAQTPSQIFPDYDYVNRRWGGDWRTPTREEFRELADNCTFSMVYNGQRYVLMAQGPNGNTLTLDGMTSDSYSSSIAQYWTVDFKEAVYYNGEMYYTAYSFYVFGTAGNVTQKQETFQDASQILYYVGIIG